MSIITLTQQILNNFSDLGLWQIRFLKKIIVTLLICRGRHNFENLSRYSTYSEVSIRKWYEKLSDFDFLKFNQHLAEAYQNEERIIAMDPCYLSKSGNKTEGIGRFWSGCHGSTQRGLETCGFASVGMRSKSALHLLAKQTIDQHEHTNLLLYYASLVEKNKERLEKISSILVVDAYFSKHTFVEKICEIDFIIVSKLSSNAKLMYQYLGKKTGKRGRPKKYDGKIDKLNLDRKHFHLCYQNDDKDEKAWEAEVYSIALKRKIKVVVLHVVNKKGNTRVETFFSTDIALSGLKILKAYRLRFQIEFLFRDAKQHLGLVQCQARSSKKIHFHTNICLTTLSLAKVAHHLSRNDKQNKPFSMASIKAMYFNENLINRFFVAFGKTPEKLINTKLYSELKSYGCIAA